MAKSRNRDRSESSDLPEHTPKERVKWLLHHKWRGKQSVMAKAIHVSLTGLSNVTVGSQDPGRLLITALVEYGDVNPLWLLIGEGPRFRSTAIPVTTTVIPGPLNEHLDLCIEETLEHFGDWYRESRYWLKVQPREVITRATEMKICSKDYLLMETDQNAFPNNDAMDQMLGVVRFHERDVPSYKLAQIDYTPEQYEEGPEQFRADSFDIGIETVSRIIIDEASDGTLQATRQLIKQGQVIPTKKPGRFKISGPENGITDRPIQHSDIIAVCILVVRLG